MWKFLFQMFYPILTHGGKMKNSNIHIFVAKIEAPPHSCKYSTSPPSHNNEQSLINVVFSKGK